MLVRNIRSTIDRYFDHAGIKGAKVNDIRHTFIAHHLMAGTSLQTVLRAVGHKRISTTEKYFDHIEKDSEAIVENIKKRVFEFSKGLPQFDDLTLILLELVKYQS